MVNSTQKMSFIVYLSLIIHLLKIQILELTESQQFNLNSPSCFYRKNLPNKRKASYHH